ELRIAQLSVRRPLALGSGKLQHGDVRVRVDADLAGYRQAASDYLDRRQIRGRNERACGGQRVRPSRADRQQPVVRLDDVARAGDDEAALPVGDGEQRLEPAKYAIAAPVLGEFHGGPGQVSREALELLLELLEEGEGIGGGSCET